MSMELRQQRPTTELGDLQFEERSNNYVVKLLNIEEKIDNSVALDVELSQVRDHMDKLSKLLDHYESVYTDYKSFLIASRISESQTKLYSLEKAHELVYHKVTAFKQKLTSMLPTQRSGGSRKHSRASHKGSSSVSSSHLTSVLLKQKAKVEEAKTRMKYASEEAELIKKEAELQASRTILKVKRELEEAETGLGAICKVLDFSDHEDFHSHKTLDVHFLTKRYLQENVNDTKPPDGIDINTSHILEAPLAPPNSVNILRPQAEPFHPSLNYMNRESDAAHLALLVTKNQLLPKRLSHFNDKPERYLTWKYSFLDVINEIKATPLERLDLLLNHLGPESVIRAENIRASNPHNPEKAVHDIWRRLDSEYGSAEVIESSLKSRIANFPSLNENDKKRYFDISDLAAEVESVKVDPKFSLTFSFYDTASGINEFVRKLPKRLRDKWASESDRYKTRNCVSHAPFSLLTKFLQDIARIKNDPGYVFETPQENSFKQRHGSRVFNRNSNKQGNASSFKTDVEQKSKDDTSEQLKDEQRVGVANRYNSSIRCAIHGTNSRHELKDCHKFLQKTLEERTEFLFKNGFCLRCCGPKRHRKRNCRENVRCNTCGSSDHITILHRDAVKEHEGEQMQNTEVKTKCTDVCNTHYNTSRSCAKIVCIKVFQEGQPSCARYIYCLIDDQSNRSLASSTFFDKFGENGPELEYVLSSCAGKFITSGRQAFDYVVQSQDGLCTLKLPRLIECNDLPSNRDEIPSQVVALNYPHLHDIASFIPPIKEDIAIELLIGRDLLTAHHVLDQRLGPEGLPFAQKLPLGWVIIGDICLGKVHQKEMISVHRTSILMDGRPSYLQPCSSKFAVKEDSVFRRTKDDEKPGLSIEDREFIRVMDSRVKRTDTSNWLAPLPFPVNRPNLPDNRPLAVKRASSFDSNLRCNPVKQDQVIEFMQKLLDNNHAEIAPNLPDSRERWYLPMFAVFHPKKPDNVRVVYDSSAKYQNISLNNVLLQGPDLCNSLLGILLRFRREKIVVTMDVEHMFYNFVVPEEERRYLRFLWHEDNNVNLPLVDYQMTRHVFGNSASPAVATYCFRKMVENSDQDIKDLINNNFYVDDGLVSCTTSEEAVDLVLRTKQVLQENGNIRLHKFASNNRDVLLSFTSDDLAKDLKDLDLGSANLPIQRSLGLSWDTDKDVFTFRVNTMERAFTRRGSLSVINSVFDPIGFAQPVVVQGKLLLREMMTVTSNSDWDNPLPESLHDRWELWVKDLPKLENLHIPRMYGTISYECAAKREVLVFSDASKDIIAAVAYLKLHKDATYNISFLLGKAKVAPSHGHSIPRLELCAAVLATQIAEIVRDQLNIPETNFHFFSDSQVVLGYISNESRRFYIYVGNRVGRIRLFSKPSQWSYIPSEENPADVATRSVDVCTIGRSGWITGPSKPYDAGSDSAPHHLVNPDSDTEIRPEVNTNKLEQSESSARYATFSERFSRFSVWRRLVHCLAQIKFCARRFRKNNANRPSSTYDSDFLRDCELNIISLIQKDVYKQEIQHLECGETVQPNSSIGSLSPFVDSNCILRVGGRLNKVSSDIISESERHPIILPKNHHVSLLIVRNYHEKVFHQGRNFTEAALRSAGYWLVGAKRTIATEIHNCVTCRRLRGQLRWQHMSDLPEDRCKPASAFSHVGVDTFGPWPVTFRRTRGGSANQKRWALLFTCLVTRAIHIEIIEELSSSAFINALRRFIAIRGPVSIFWSDRGTNFIGALDSLAIDAEFVEKGPVAEFLSDSRIVWKFNPPHAPHMGGAWERLIGTVKRILNSMLLQHKYMNLTHDALITFMAETCAIVNNRPLIDISSNPDSPEMLTPSRILTMKTGGDVNPFPPFGSKDALKSVWKCVQVLADEFWRKWRAEYLHHLQHRSKWQGHSRDLKSGDLVLVKDDECSRNYWPLGKILQTFPSKDEHIRKVEVLVCKDNKRTSYIRPVTQLVLLHEAD